MGDDGDGITSGDSKHPLFVHMEGREGLFISILYHTYGWTPLGKLST